MNLILIAVGGFVAGLFVMASIVFLKEVVKWVFHCTD